MKNFFVTLSVIFASLVFVACEKEPPYPDEPPITGEDPVDPETPNQDEDSVLFYINVQADKLAAYSVTFDIKPSDTNRPYYYDIISKGRFQEVNIPTLKTDLTESANKLAELTGSSVDEVLGAMLVQGDKLDICSNAGYRPETDFYIYAFYWDATGNEDLCVCEFSTPEALPSAEYVEVSATSDPHSMLVDVAPSNGVTEYWYYFAERTKAEAMLNGLEDENAFLSYHAMNVGTRKDAAETIEERGLKPATEYMVLIMAIDNQLNRFMVSEIFVTPEENTQQRVESELFEELLGKWVGVQTISDLYEAPFENTFTVTIKSEIEDYDYNYRDKNQLVATVDGWCNIPYYGVTGLVQEGIENPEEKWGPRWLFNIADGDVVTMDGKLCNSVVGWLFMGDCYMLNMQSDGSAIYTDVDFDVVVSEDRNTMIIKSPENMENVYPGIGYNFQGFGWMGYYYGCSDIVLTRK